jgi:REP element-mobilizing transposase RayT
MPRKNLVKQFKPHSDYHVHSRGFDRLPVFVDKRDAAAFLGRLRSLLITGRPDPMGLATRLDVTLLAYALLPNHFHFLLHQGDDRFAIRKLMYALKPPYARYFSDRYGLKGKRPVWEGAYYARPIADATDRMEVVTYIHLNRSGHERSEYTSHPCYLGTRSDSWIDHRRGLRPFGGREGYENFMADRERVRVARRMARELDR